VAKLDNIPTTPAIRVLREHGVAFTNHPYSYADRGGTAVSARELGVPEHAIIKTLVMEDDARRPEGAGLHAETIVDIPRVYINGGRHGYLIGLAPTDIVRVLAPTLVDIVQSSSDSSGRA
jgi:prolyl-tRNA editing enzyme YbaK/EbsC (Cys-tRNA(Pro) deacylase)